jgi:ketosteroid isomerase-like protein
MKRINRVIAENEIQRLTTAYSHAIMRRDGNAAAQTYADNGVLSAFYAPDIVGRPAIAEVLCSVLQPLHFICQTASAGVIDLSDDTAHATWTVTEHFKFKDADELGCCFGMYEDTLSRYPEGWRFTQRRFTPFYRGTIASKGKTYQLPEFGSDFAFGLLFNGV